MFNDFDSCDSFRLSKPENYIYSDSINFLNKNMMNYTGHVHSCGVGNHSNLKHFVTTPSGEKIPFDFSSNQIPIQKIFEAWIDAGYPRKDSRPDFKEYLHNADLAKVIKWANEFDNKQIDELEEELWNSPLGAPE